MYTIDKDLFEYDQSWYNIPKNKVC